MVHKIQSHTGPLDMRLAQVPKMLLALRKDWAPLAFCISFKVRYLPVECFNFDLYLSSIRLVIKQLGRTGGHGC